MTLMRSLEKLNPSLIVLSGFVLVPVIGIIDFLLGYEFGFSVFYTIPIALITWFGDRKLGILASLCSALVWMGADITSGHIYSHPLISIWNTLIRLTFFLIITGLLAALAGAAMKEKELSRTDSLTLAVNSRYFYELIRMEISRMDRYGQPFSLIYFDLDNFKQVNDRFGHQAGNEVLRTVVSRTREILRVTDIIARLGGDEFGVLLPETDSRAVVPVARKLQTELLNTMGSHQWPVTFSMGVVTCRYAPASPDELLKLADDMMYSVKHSEKNGIRFGELPGPGISGSI